MVGSKVLATLGPIVPDRAPRLSLAGAASRHAGCGGAVEACVPQAGNTRPARRLAAADLLRPLQSAVEPPTWSPGCRASRLDDGDDRRGFGATRRQRSRRRRASELEGHRFRAARAHPRRPRCSGVEIISGGGSPSDASGRSRIANVVLKPSSGLSMPTSYILGVRQLEYSNRLGYTLQLSKTLSLARIVAFALDLQGPNIRGTAGRRRKASMPPMETPPNTASNTRNRTTVQPAAGRKPLQ